MSQPKTVYISFFFHGNMCYDRYTKQLIRERFPVIYAKGMEMLADHPETTAHIDFPGLTVDTLRRWSPSLVTQIRKLVKRKQVVMVGCQYAASHALVTAEEVDFQGSRLGMEIMREVFGECQAFFPQEIAFHPQQPLIMKEIGVRHLVVFDPAWPRPKKIVGLDGRTSVIAFPGSPMPPNMAALLEGKHDALADGDFLLIGGDFELLGDIDALRQEIARLAEKGKIFKWITFADYEKERPDLETLVAPGPFGTAPEDRSPSPSFSRWTADPWDMQWRQKLQSASALVHAADWINALTGLNRLPEADADLEKSRCSAKQSHWSAWFEDAGEFPDVERKFLSRSNQRTLLSHAWHNVLIGANSDSSGWVPWLPRTRHRMDCCDRASDLALEVIRRGVSRLSEKNPAGKPGRKIGILNPDRAGKKTVSFETPEPATLVGLHNKPLATSCVCRGGRWVCTAEVSLPSYGGRIFRLGPGGREKKEIWTVGPEIAYRGTGIKLSGRKLLLTTPRGRAEIFIPPFVIHTPNPADAPEEVVFNWEKAVSRINRSRNSLEVTAELTWAVWLRCVFTIAKNGSVLVKAELTYDLPRAIGSGPQTPDGIILALKWQPAECWYDIPFGVIEHKNPAKSYVACSRWAALDNRKNCLAFVSVSGSQSVMFAGAEGIIGLNLGASTEGQPQYRPDCVINQDGFGEHILQTGLNLIYGRFENEAAILFRKGSWNESDLPGMAQNLITRPVVLNLPDRSGAGEIPGLTLSPSHVRITAFRKNKTGCEIILNETLGRPAAGHISVAGRKAKFSLPGFGLTTVTFPAR